MYVCHDTIRSLLCLVCYHRESSHTVLQYVYVVVFSGLGCLTVLVSVQLQYLIMKHHVKRGE
jgi:hypothetical protein